MSIVCEPLSIFGVAADEWADFRSHMDARSERRKTHRAAAPKVRAGRRPRKQRRAKTTPEMEWLRQLISPLLYGEKTPDGIRPSIKKAEFVARWNLGLGPYKLPNYKLLDHFEGRETVYFVGDRWAGADRTLGMIDIDVLKAKGLGSPEGARAFAAHLKAVWPDLYLEPSTGGQGVHGYFILWKKGTNARRTNAALKRLEAWLRAEVRRVNADIETVEVKGTCPDLTFGGGLLQAVKYGMFAKLPRDVARFAEWQATTVLRVCDLESSVYDVTEPAAVERVAAPDQPQVVASASTPSTRPALKSVKAVGPKEKVGTAGSVSGKVIGDEELAAIPAFERLYRAWVGPDDLMAGKFRVTPHDFAVAMVLLRHFRADPNTDRSLPCRRAGELWTGLYRAGDVERGWNHHRWKRIRDFLSGRGHIDWTDHRYDIPAVVKNEDGNKDQKRSRRGTACKWAITEDFDLHLEGVALIAAPSTGGASFVDTSVRRLVPTQGRGKNLRPTPCSLSALRFWQRAEAACDLLCAA
jgi:hypothetical protein